MAARKRPLNSTGPAQPRPLVYTAQDVAGFCEVDLKTIHHWADAGKIPHRRTEGRHLRFRRNDVLAFLRSHGYPLPPSLTTEKPQVFFASLDPAHDEVARKLAAKFWVRRFDSAAVAAAYLLSDEPDALIILPTDPTWSPAATEALSAHPDTSWLRIVVQSELGRIHLELPRALDVE
jgi:excisionase family DNA binding protein